MLSTHSNALGLGDINVYSKYGEPLRAQINFLNSFEIERGKILVTLATESDYELAQVKRESIHSELRFKLNYNGSEPVVDVSSVSPINNEVIKFLVQARWPQGKLLREYSVRLTPGANRQTAQTDNLPPPPDVKKLRNIAPNRQADTTINDRNTGLSNLPPAPDVTLTRSTPSAPVATAPINQNQQPNPAPRIKQWKVRKGETLWSIATVISRRINTGVHKTAKSLYQNNLNAFLNGNINQLIKDSILNIPSKEIINATLLNDAITLFVANKPVQAKSNSGIIDGNNIISSGLSGTAQSVEEVMALFEQRLDEISNSNVDLSNQMTDLNEQVDNLESVMEINNQEINKLSIDNLAIRNLQNPSYDQYLIIAVIALVVVLAVALLLFILSLIFKALFNRSKPKAKPNKEHTNFKESSINRQPITNQSPNNNEQPMQQAPSGRAKYLNDNNPNSNNNSMGNNAMGNNSMGNNSMNNTTADSNQVAGASQGNAPDQLASADDEDSIQLELANAYLDLGDTKGAEEMLMEVLEVGNANQRRKAKLLLSQNSL